MPEYLKDHMVYYAGPAKTPRATRRARSAPPPRGAWTAYVDLLQAAGGSFVMLAKGNRSPQVTDACKKHGGFYLGSIGGPAARLAQDCIKKVEVLEYPELGMEAVWKIEVEDFPAFIVVDDKGNDFFVGPRGRGQAPLPRAGARAVRGDPALAPRHPHHHLAHERSPRGRAPPREPLAPGP
jgi:fumarate hydratase class I